MKTIIVTGVAGFIGHALTIALLAKGYRILGIDFFGNNNDEISILKKHRLSECSAYSNFSFLNLDIKEISEKDITTKINNVDYVVNLAANAGIRDSARQGKMFLENNVIGFYNMLELCIKLKVDRFIYASSSSIYGNKDSDVEYCPMNIYAATKVMDEMLAAIYSKRYSLKTIGLRFFSVYGPYGRPDMAPWIFADAIKNNREIFIANNGKVLRDFTYIDDVVNAITKTIVLEPQVTYSTYDVGSMSPHSLNELVDIIEKNYNTKVKKNVVSLKSEEAISTKANMHNFFAIYGDIKFTNFTDGITSFCKWFDNFKTLK